MGLVKWKPSNSNQLIVSPYETISSCRTIALRALPTKSDLQLRILHPRDFIFECLVSQAIQIFRHAEDPIAETES